LLLASYVFPLALKRKLSDAGYYSLTKDDDFQLFAFERLAATEMTGTYEDGQKHPWHDAISDMVFKFPGGLREEV